MPDGISLDAEGGVWVASHHRVIRVIEGGTVTDEVDMGPTRATACMLGGADGKTLLITASDSHDRSIITDNPSGRIFSVNVAVHAQWTQNPAPAPAATPVMISATPRALPTTGNDVGSLLLAAFALMVLGLYVRARRTELCA